MFEDDAQRDRPNRVEQRTDDAGLSATLRAAPDDLRGPLGGAAEEVKATVSDVSDSAGYSLDEVAAGARNLATAVTDSTLAFVRRSEHVYLQDAEEVEGGHRLKLSGDVSGYVDRLREHLDYELGEYDVRVDMNVSTMDGGDDLVVDVVETTGETRTAGEGDGAGTDVDELPRS